MERLDFFCSCLILWLILDINSAYIFSLNQYPKNWLKSLLGTLSSNCSPLQKKCRSFIRVFGGITTYVNTLLSMPFELPNQDNITILYIDAIWNRQKNVKKSALHKWKQKAPYSSHLSTAKLAEVYMGASIDLICILAWSDHWANQPKTLIHSSTNQ